MSAPNDPSRQAVVDQEHLKILSIAYLVSACWSAAMSLFGLLYAAMGVGIGQVILNAPRRAGEQPPPEFLGWFFAIFGLGMFTVLITLGVLKFFVYRSLKLRRGRVFCMVVAGINCLGVPFGTLLGVFTFIVLGRPSVIKLFEQEFPD